MPRKAEVSHLPTILDSDGKTVRYLSKEIYVVGKPSKDDDAEIFGGSKYLPGTRVRLISGINNSNNPGHHFQCFWVTVCRLDATRAEYLGFHKGRITLEKTPPKKMYCWSCLKVKTFTDYGNEGLVCKCGHFQESEAGGAAELCLIATWHDMEEYNRLATIARDGGYTIPEKPNYFLDKKEINNKRKEITNYIKAWIVEALKNYSSFEALLEDGLCADLADNISRNFPNVMFFNTGDDEKTPVHTWISYGGYHFDMQNPEGVKDWKKLLYFKDTDNPKLDLG